MTKKAIGLDENGILLADMTKDGVMPTEDEFVALGKTYKDTAILETAEGETVPCDCEEDDEPEDEIYTPGATTLKYSTSDLDPASCYKAFGGKYDEATNTWEAPDQFKSKEVFVKYTTRTGLVVVIGRAKMFTRMNWAIKKDGYGLLEHTLKVLTPKKGGAKKMTVKAPVQAEG